MLISEEELVQWLAQTEDYIKLTPIDLCLLHAFAGHGIIPNNVGKCGGGKVLFTRLLLVIVFA